MSALRLCVAVGAVVAALSALVVGATAATPTVNPCKGIKDCITVPGPWVAVPTQGEVDFLLECPKRAGTIGGVDALASSTDVHLSWDGRAAVPLKPGTITGSVMFFRAGSAHGRPGSFQATLGCIPPPKTNPRSTLSARVTHPVEPFDHWQTTVKLLPGARQLGARACGKKERLVSGWEAVAFDTGTTPPNPALAGKVHVKLTVGDVRVVASIRTDAGMPASAKAEVQVGAVCAA